MDWSNLNEQVSKYFKVRECTYLPSWSVYHKTTTAEQEAITKLCNTLDLVREYFNASINVHCFLRPNSVNCDGIHNGGDYNKFVGGAVDSSHIFGNACDFDITGYNCDQVKQKILDNNMLEVWNLRMENNGKGANWIHLSNDWKPGHNRFFIP